MLQRDQILSTLQSHKDVLIGKYNIKALGLFGSYSRNDATEESDIDLLVDFSKPIGVEFIDLAYELEDLLQHKVDLVSLNGIKPRYFEKIQPDLIYV